MKEEKILFIISLLSILLLLFVSINNKTTKTATIKKIKNFPSYKEIILSNNQTILLFYSGPINLKPGDKISYISKKDVYGRKTETIAEKIEKVT